MPPRRRSAATLRAIGACSCERSDSAICTLRPRAERSNRTRVEPPESDQIRTQAPLLPTAVRPPLASGARGRSSPAGTEDHEGCVDVGRSEWPVSPSHAGIPRMAGALPGAMRSYGGTRGRASSALRPRKCGHRADPARRQRRSVGSASVTGIAVEVSRLRRADYLAWNRSVYRTCRPQVSGRRPRCIASVTGRARRCSGRCSRTPPNRRWGQVQPVAAAAIRGRAFGTAATR